MEEAAASKSVASESSRASAAAGASSPPRGSTLVVYMVILANYLCGGIIFGWAPLQVLMEKDGIYRSACEADEPATCASRTNRFLFLYTLGTTVFSLGSVANGFLVDWAGPLPCNILSAVLVPAGLALFAISDDSQDFFAIAVCLMGFSGSLVQISALPIAFVLPPSQRPWVMTAINSAFDAAPTVFLAVYVLFERFGISRQLLFACFAAGSVVLHVALIAGWSLGSATALRAVQLQELELNKAESCEGAEPQLETMGAFMIEAPQKSADAVSFRTMSFLPDPTQLIASISMRRTASTTMGCARASSLHLKQGHEALSQCGGPVSATDDKKPHLQGLPLLKQLVTFEFTFVLISYGLQTFRNNGHLGMAKVVLEELGDASTGYLFTQIFAASMPASLLVLPCMSAWLARGFGPTYLLIVTLGMIWNGVALIPSLPLQLMSFAAYTVFRAMFFSAHFLYIGHTFGSLTSSRVHGLTALFAGLLIPLTYQCLVVAESLPGSPVTWIYGLMLLLNVPPTVYALLLPRRLALRPEDDLCGSQ